MSVTPMSVQQGMVRISILSLSGGNFASTGTTYSSRSCSLVKMLSVSENFESLGAHAPSPPKGKKN